MKNVDDNLLAEITRRLVTEFQPDQITLVGSHAWGTPTGNSDVDLLVIVPESDMSPARRAAQAHRCLVGLNISKDILIRDCFKSPILQTGPVSLGQLTLYSQ